jgi:prepilin-type N-terminal cleavage/methylation domain-containing protein
MTSVKPSPLDKLAELRLWWVCASALYLKPSPVLQAHALRWLGWLPKPCHRRCLSGFTLAELLISLAVLGVIATFTIPKVLQAQKDERYNAIAKEVVGAIEASYDVYRQSNVPGNSTLPSAILPYLNYVASDTGAWTIDRRWDQGTTVTCASTRPCVRFHNGSVLMFGDWASFGGTQATNAVTFYLDPDGKVTIDGAAYTEGKSVQLVLYINGRITTWESMTPGTTGSNGSFSPSPPQDPPWFHWD